MHLLHLHNLCKNLSSQKNYGSQANTWGFTKAINRLTLLQGTHLYCLVEKSIICSFSHYSCAISAVCCSTVWAFPMEEKLVFLGILTPVIKKKILFLYRIKRYEPFINSEIYFIDQRKNNLNHMYNTMTFLICDFPWSSFVFWL